MLLRRGSASDQDLREKIVSGGRERSYRVFVPDGFGKSGPGPAVVLFNGSGSNVDGLMDPWKDIARKEGVLLIGPGAFQQGAWRIPEDSPDFTSEVVRSASKPGSRSIRAAFTWPAIPAAPATCCCSGCSSPNTSPRWPRMRARCGRLIRALLDVPKRKIPMAIWIGTKDQMVPLKMVRDTLARADGARVSGEGDRKFLDTRTRTPSARRT